MPDETLTEQRGAGKPPPVEWVSAAVWQLVAKVGVAVRPGRPAASHERVILAIDPRSPFADRLARIIADGRAARVDAGLWDGGAAVLWACGPFRLADFSAAVSSPDPLEALCRTVEGGEDALHALICRKHRARYVPLPPKAMPSGARFPQPRAAGHLGAARFKTTHGDRMILAPRLAELDPVLADLGPGRRTLLVTSRRRLTTALRGGIGPWVVAEAVDRLAGEKPDLSARFCPSPLQKSLVIALAAALLAGFCNFAAWLTEPLFALTSFAFLAQTMLRVRAAQTFDAARPAVPPPLGDADLPSATVLVPLYREAEIAEPLVCALAALDYPPDRLEVFVLCEADDAATIAAAERAMAGREGFSVIAVPPGQPRTKPRALCHGLAFARGEMVSVYDAEDRPDRDQLRRAAAALAHGPDDLAVVQARLEIATGGGALQRQFALEYAALFDGYLPYLALRGLPMPLGGTSNHFKRRALEDVGGWDPFNVTEDADLGIRLARFGFRSGIVDSATLETAPGSVRIWVRQRSRWIKGWLMTWLVHMRSPGLLVREIGLGRAVMLQAHLVAMVLSPLCYPFGALLSAAYVSGLAEPPGERSLVLEFAVSATILSLVTCVTGTVWLSRRVAATMREPPRLGDYAMIAPYWLLGSFAAWVAVAEILVKPHYWAKTPHGTDHPARQSNPDAPRISLTRPLPEANGPRSESIWSG